MPKLNLNSIKTSVTFATESVEAFAKHTAEKAKSAVKAALPEYAAKVEASAKQLCPVDEGILRDSIHVRMSESGLRATVRTDARTAPHGHLVHFGTVRMEGTPFLYQAAEAHPKEELAAAVKSKLKG